MIGTTLDEKYRILRLLGRGGMGSVLEAEDLRTGQLVAIKVIHAELPGRAPDIAERFAREARAAGSIDTEHIARCLDSGIDPATGQPYMVLEHLSGEDLHRVLRRTGPIDPAVALRVIAQACVGLSRAHEASVVHRDIKPANIFLATRPGTESEADRERVVKLLDFGIAKIRRGPDENMTDSDALTRTGSMLGSPMYMSPEQARSVRNVDHRADIWSLGVVLYQAVAGRTPFEHISGLGDLVLALWSEAPPPVQQFAPWVPPEIAAIIDRMLRLDPTERYQSAAEVLDAVSAFLRDGHVLRESMLVPAPAEIRERPAATFFRRLDTRPRPFERLRTDASPMSSMGGPRSQAAPPVEGQSPMASTGDPIRTGESGPGVARAPSPSQNSENGSAPVAGMSPGLTTTNVALATNAAGGSKAPPGPARSPIGARAIGVAVLGLVIGVGGVFLAVSSSGKGPDSASPAASSALIAAPIEPPHREPAVAPVGSVTSDPPAPSTSVSAAPGASAAPTVTAASTGAAAPAPTTPKPQAAEPARPRPTPPPAASATAAATATQKPGFTDFGDRK